VGPRSQQVTNITVFFEELLLQLSNCIRVGLLIAPSGLVSGRNVLLSFTEDTVNLLNKLIKGGQVLQQTLRDQDTTVVIIIGGSLANSVANTVHDVLQSFLIVVALLANDYHVGAGIQGALKSQVRWFVTHEANKVPVLDGRCTISQHVSYQLRVNLTC